jgi:hypothetical protein
MKQRKILKFFGAAIILTLLIAVIPVAPVFAAGSLALNPTQGKIGDSIHFTGTGWPVVTGDIVYGVDIFMSDQQTTLSGAIDTAITRYRLVTSVELDTDGSITGTFTVPTTLNQGTLGTSTPLSLVVGSTYYVYATNRYDVEGTASKAINALTTFTITQGANIEFTPTSGPAGGVVQITGTNFPASSTIIIKLDSTAVPITSGDTVTRSTGILISNITIPSGTAAGAHTITVTAGTSTATVNFSVTASAALDALSPASGPAGSDVNISGSNFPVSATLTFKVGAATVTPKSGDTTTRSSGIFISVVTIPAGTAAGAQTISVTAGTTTAIATFTVTAPPATTTTTPPATTTTTPPATTTTIPPTTTTTTPKPGTTTLTINKSGNNIGSAIGIGGSGFKKNGTVTLKYDDKTVGTATADASGFFVATFQVPPSKFGPHTITATDGTYTNTTTFEVESVAPKTPQPLSPAMGVTIKSPLKFDWADATDNSTPITYKLQIATATNFAADTIIIDKSGLTTSEYTLSEMEGLRLESNEGTLYWREKAIDGAQNESDWTGAGTFSVAQPFKFSGWPMIVIIIVGAIVMWLFGFWIGRKTAFYY